LHPALPRRAATLLGRGTAFDKLAGELLVDSGAFRTATGWNASVSLADGVIATAKSFVSPGVLYP
jgi:hypothetical protein